MDQESRKASEWGVKERDLGGLGGRGEEGDSERQAQGRVACAFLSLPQEKKGTCPSPQFRKKTNCPFLNSSSEERALCLLLQPL